MIQSNINSFGDDIGKITNRITSMFDVIAQYEKGSPEYEVLDYRIKCGQKYQQDAIKFQSPRSVMNGEKNMVNS